MNIDNLRPGLPGYTKDMKLNLGTLIRSTELSEQQLQGTLLVSAATIRNEAVFSEIAEEAREHLPTEAFGAALGTATVMGMNNVAYRTRYMLGDDYAQVKFGLRVNIISKPGIEKEDFELWSLAVSAINGCEACVAFHAQTVRDAGLTKEQVQETVKVAGTVPGVAQAVFVEASR